MTHPTTTAGDLYAAILREPWADAPRLVYADWLDENGESERAEFVRVQIELAKTPEPDYKTIGHFWTKEPPWWADAHGCVKCRGWYTGYDDGFKPCKYHALHFREKELWIAHGREWFAEAISFIPNGDSAKNYISRGFPASVSLTLAQFWGGECERCTGGYEVYTEPASRFGVSGRECPDCKGTGRIPGLVESLAARWPVVEIRLVDREPWYERGCGGEHCWWRESAWRTLSNDRTGNITDELFDKIAALHPDNRLSWSGPSHNQHIGFDTITAAQLALSRACVDESRARAGLPAMKWRK